MKFLKFILDLKWKKVEKKDCTVIKQQQQNLKSGKFLHNKPMAAIWTLPGLTIFFKIGKKLTN